MSSPVNSFIVSPETVVRCGCITCRPNLRLLLCSKAPPLNSPLWTPRKPKLSRKGYDFATVVSFARSHPSRGEQSGGGTKTMTAQHLRVAAAAIVWAAPVIAFSPSLVAPGGPLPVRLSSRPQVPGVTLLRPTTGLRAPALQMAGAGGAAVNLDSSDFDQGDADPIGSIDALNQVCPSTPASKTLPSCQFV